MFRQILQALGITEQIEVRESEKETAILSSSQLKCLQDVCSVIRNEYVEPAYRSEQDEEEMISTALDISSMENSIGNIISNLQNNRVSKERFKKMYPKWKQLREESIRKLLEIAESIDNDRNVYNWRKLAGYGTSFVGGGMTLASICSMPVSKGMPAHLAKAGAILTVIGLGGLLGTSYFEYYSLKKNVNGAQEITKNDKEYFEEMREWLKCTTELERALDEVFKIHLAKEMLESVQQLVEEALSIANDDERYEFIRESLREIIEKLPPSLQTPVRIILVGTTIQILVTITLLNMKNRFVIDFSVFTIKTFVTSFPYLDDLLGPARFASMFPNDVLGKSMERAIVRRAFAAFGMAMDFAGIIITSMDIKGGSKSPQAEMISKVAIELRKEANVVATIYGYLD